MLKNIASAWLPALAVLGLMPAGCGSGARTGSGVTTSTVSSVAAAGGTVQIVMKSLAFNPPAIQAKVGQRVVWINEDSLPHNVTYVSGPRFGSSRPSIRRGTTFSVRLAKPGTIHYYCSLHPWMTATIAVSR